jgi:hypothetical protein
MSAPSMTRRPSLVDPGDVTRAAAIVIAPTLLIALATALFAQGEAQRALGPPRPEQGDLADAWSIAQNNIRIGVGLLVTGWLLSSWWRSPSRAARAAAHILLGAAATGIALSAWSIGRALGAYPAQIIAGVAAHAPLELGALCVSVAVVLRSLREPAPAVRSYVTVATLVGVALVPAALLEVYA